MALWIPVFTRLPGTRGCSRVLTVYGIETRTVLSLWSFLRRCSRVLTVYGIETTYNISNGSINANAAVRYLPFTVFKFPQTQKAHRIRIDSGFCVLFTCRTEDRLFLHGFQAEDISGRSFFAGNLKMKRLHPGLYYRHQKRSGLWKKVTGCLFGMYLLYCFKMTDEWLGWWWKEVCHGEEAQKEPQTLYRPETCVMWKEKEVRTMVRRKVENEKKG